MMHDYQKACDSAADVQGITAIRDELRRRGINSEVWQTGGFCMLCAVPLERNARGVATRYIGCTSEGAGVVAEDDDGECEEWQSIIETTDTPEDATPSAIADAVVAWLRDQKMDANATKVEGGILTVAALRQILAGARDDDQVVIASGVGCVGDYLNVGSVVVPNHEAYNTGEGGFCAVTLFTADTYDPRQH